MTQTVYFAYGSNMSRRRLGARVTSAEYLGMGLLRHYSLAFHKISETDRSGKCDIVYSRESAVYGALFQLAEVELPTLDWYEGTGIGYERHRVSINNSTGQPVDAWTYIATRTNSKLRPYHWYKRHVLEGALETGLPEDYVRIIEAVEAIDDPNVERSSRELAIYA